jgi:hypothetical protein
MTDESSATAISMAYSAAISAGVVGGAHHTRHQDGGVDEINVDGLSGVLAEGQNPAAHHATHQRFGSDPIDVTGLAGLPAGASTADSQALSIENSRGLSQSTLISSAKSVGVSAVTYASSAVSSAVTGPISQANSKAVSAATFASSAVSSALTGPVSIADSKAESAVTFADSQNTAQSTLIATADSKGESGSTRASSVSLSASTGISNALVSTSQISVSYSATSEDVSENILSWNATTSSAVSSLVAGGGGGAVTRRIHFPAAVFETRVAAGWAAFVQTQGTNFDFGELDFDKDTDEIAYTPPFKMENYDGGNITARILFKANNATTSVAIMDLSFIARAIDGSELFDAAPGTSQAISAAYIGTAERIQEMSSTYTPNGVAADDICVIKLQRDADNASDTLAADVKFVELVIEYTEA